MKIRITLEVDVSFDLESDGVLHTEAVISSDEVSQAVVSVLHTDIVTDSMIEAITDAAGWCVSSFALTTPDANCVENIG